MSLTVNEELLSVQYEMRSQWVILTEDFAFVPWSITINFLEKYGDHYLDNIS